VTWNYTLFGTDASKAWTVDEGWSIAYRNAYSDVDYQVHDFEVSRSILDTAMVDLNVFGGFRWGKIDHYRVTDKHVFDIVADGEGGEYERGAFRDIDRNSSNTDSYGARLGGEFRCAIIGNLDVFGRGAFTGMYSTTQHTEHTTYREDNWRPGFAFYDIFSSTDNHENHAVDTAVGVIWTHECFDLQAGYEWNIWKNAVSYRRNSSDYRDLVLDGWFARLGVTF
jgi:hypothetical protein